MTLSKRCHSQPVVPSLRYTILCKRKDQGIRMGCLYSSSSQNICCYSIMDSALLPALACATGAYALWRIFFMKSSLANVPGPRKASWWKGEFSSSKKLFCFTIIIPEVRVLRSSPNFRSRTLTHSTPILILTHRLQCIGCFDLVWSENGWDFHRQLIEKYGSVVRIPMLFGVCLNFITPAKIYSKLTARLG